MRRLLTLAIVAALVFVVLRSQGDEPGVQAKLKSLTLRVTGEENASSVPGELEAPEVLARVRRHMIIPASPAPTVAAVVDVQKLRAKNPAFYAEAENGDYLIVTAAQAILYSIRRDIVLVVASIEMHQKAARIPFP